MSLLRTGHGPQDWQDQGPSSVNTSGWFRGAPLEGAPGTAETDRETQRKYKRKYKARLRAKAKAA